jgi:hypothetical protein
MRLLIPSPLAGTLLLSSNPLTMSCCPGTAQYIRSCPTFTLLTRIMPCGGNVPRAGLSRPRARPLGFRPFRHVLSSVGLIESGLRFKTSLSSGRSVIGQRNHVPPFMRTSRQV